MFSGLINGISNSVDDFIEDPLGKTVEMATQPIRDGLEIVDGLTEGELRYKAALRLGTDVASGMCASELLEWYQGD